MQLGDINAQVRILLAEPDSTGRWSDTDLASLINQGQKAVVKELEFPEGTLVNQTTAGQQEYTIPEVFKILRVYVAGQPIIQTDIPTLEGAQIEMYDQSAPNYLPQWLSQNSTAYPVASDTGYPYPSTLPFYAGQRPQWYLRGGNIGLVPPPAGTYTLQIDIVPVPAALANAADVSTLPSNFLQAIAWYAVYQAKFADSRLEDAAFAMQQFEGEMGKLRAWKSSFKGSTNRAPVLLTYRSMTNTGPVGED